MTNKEYTRNPKWKGEFPYSEKCKHNIYPQNCDVCNTKEDYNTKKDKQILHNKEKELEEFNLIEFVNADEEKKQKMLSKLPILELKEKQ